MKINEMECIKEADFFVKTLENNIPFGDFCYCDVNTYVRYYCKHLDNDPKGEHYCTLYKTEIFDFIKACNINKYRGVL